MLRDGAESKLKASEKFDVWSFGVIMYEMLCDRSPPLINLPRMRTLSRTLRYFYGAQAPFLHAHFFSQPALHALK
jgi:serine/threonine protein kinase